MITYRNQRIHNFYTAALNRNNFIDRNYIRFMNSAKFIARQIFSKSITVIENLFRYNGLRYESFHDDKEGLESIRVNKFRNKTPLSKNVTPFVAHKAKKTPTVLFIDN